MWKSLDQWFSIFPTLQPLNTVPHGLLTQTIKLFHSYLITMILLVMSHNDMPQFMTHSLKTAGVEAATRAWGQI